MLWWLANKLEDWAKIQWGSCYMKICITSFMQWAHYAEYRCEGGIVVSSVCLFVCLLLSYDHEIFRASSYGQKEGHV